MSPWHFVNSSATPSTARIREKGDWSGVKIEVVDEAQVRAKRDHTRVFVPMNAEVLEFFNSLGKWFLHFSRTRVAEQGDSAEGNRNLGDRKAAVIYRRGVRVREFESVRHRVVFSITTWTTSRLTRLARPVIGT